MIFVTIGTQQQNFDRLFDYINKIDSDEDIIVQKGKSNYRFNVNIKSYNFLSYEEMDKYLNEARVVITHGGGGTIFKALKLNKKIIVVPRLSKYKEHINDHQLEFSLYLKKMNYCFVVQDENEFFDALNSIDNYKFSKYISKEKKFINNIEKEIDALLGE